MFVERRPDIKSIVATCKNNVDLYNYIQKRVQEKGEKYWGHIADSKSGGDWYGGVTYEQAMNNLLFGNKDTTRMFLDGLADSRKEADVFNEIFLDTEGFAYDIGSFVEGNPECCLNSIGEAPKKTITIGVPYDYHCGNKSKVIAWRGMAITNLVYTLINKGYIVNLKFIECYRPIWSPEFGGVEYHRSYFSVDVPTENICIGTIAFYCSVEFFRIIMILAQSMFCEQPDRAGNGKGTREMADLYLMYGKDMFIVPDGYLDRRMEELSSLEEANKIVSELFNEYCAKEGLQCI